MTMTIDEAIKRLNALREGCSGKDLDPERIAINLGIEALERVKEIRVEDCSIRNLMSWPLRDETP